MSRKNHEMLKQASNLCQNIARLLLKIVKMLFKSVKMPDFLEIVVANNEVLLEPAVK